MLRVEDLMVGYGGARRSSRKPVIESATFDIGDGDVVWLRGPSGSGKTTLCMAVSGYVEPWEGRIVLDDGILLEKGEEHQAAAANGGWTPGASKEPENAGSANRHENHAYPIQYIGQHPELMLDPRMRMRDSLEEALRGAGAESYDPHLIHHLGLRDEWMDRYPHELSGGELQRFCITRALASDPRILVCDEISTMLDALTQARLWHVLLDEVNRRNMGLLITTQSTSLGERVSTRVIDMEDMVAKR